MSDTLVITMPDDCTLRAVRTLHGEITAALAATANLTLDCSGVARADIAFVQLVLAAAGTAERAAKRLALVDAPDSVEGAFARAGLSAQGPYLRAA
ncbi:STAS domain-containing protein [Methylobacterium sp. Gmos1]